MIVSVLADTKRAHPRSRGENILVEIGGGGTTGSSPLTRGKRFHDRCRGYRDRLIPAHAGKTPLSKVLARTRPAHPRSRGENGVTAWTRDSVAGSSPLTRGKRRPPTRSVGGLRLIPAHAGKTLVPAGRMVIGGAHPRSRGENADATTCPLAKYGSSPLTRGKHFPTCAFTAQIDQILETLELAVSSGSYSVWVACATDAPQDQVRSIGLVLPSSRGAS